MSPIGGSVQANLKLAQFKFGLEKHLIISENNIEWIFQKISNFHDKIQTTKYLQSHHPELIDCTILHLAVHFGSYEICQILIDKGVDFTLKNNDGATALHLATEKNCNEIIIADMAIFLKAHLRHNNFVNPCNKYGLSHFHIACSAGNAELVEKFLNHGVSVDHAMNSDSSLYPAYRAYTPLHFAVDRHHIEVTKVLLSHGANIHIKDARGVTPLQQLFEKFLEAVDSSIADDKEPHILNKRAKSSKTAENFKNESCKTYLIDAFATLMKLFSSHYRNAGTVVDDSGLSQLHLSCTLGDLTEIESLLEKFENINHHISMDALHWPGYTALHFAAHANIDTVKLLLKNEAYIEVRDAKGVTPFDICLRRYDLLDIHSIILLISSWRNIVLSDDRTRLSDLIFAMRDADCFQQFLSRLTWNSHVHVPNDSPLWPGFSLMHLSLSLNMKEDMQDLILQKLFDQEPELLFVQEIHGCTPLHLAFKLKKHHVVHLLIEYHKSFDNPANVIDEDGLSYTHIASIADDQVFLEKLLFSGSDVNAVYKGTSMKCRGLYPGSTPLHFAVASDSHYAMEILLRHDADVYAKDERDMTAIHRLAIANHCEDQYEVRKLLSNLDLKDSIVSGLGLSHLHVACLRGYSASTEFLLKNGANIHQMLTKEPITSEGLLSLNDWLGYSPLRIALEKGHQQCVDLIIKHDPEFLAGDNSLISGILENTYKFKISCLRLKISTDLKERLRLEFGVTDLHLACWAYLRQSRDKIVEYAADVNVQIRKDSPVWPGWTPLHIFISQFGDDVSLIDAFIEAGIDVTLANAAGDTVVHLAYRQYCSREGYGYSLLKKLLQAQRDFSVNPTSFDGTSHFHIACALGNASIVEKFLLQPNLIDVNEPADFFHDGQTPLHLAASCRSGCNSHQVQKQMRVIELLLEHGANVHAENSSGNTALHEWACTLYSSFDIFDRIVRQGADVNAKNILGHTPLKYLLSQDDITLDEFEMLMEAGCNFNAFNPVTEEGCLDQAIYSLPDEEIESLITILNTEYSSLIEPDSSNRTIIHNIASTIEIQVTSHLNFYDAWSEEQIPVDRYVFLIEQFLRIGYDVDDQDIKGRSALHLAAKAHNVKAFHALLIAGADVELVDTRGIRAIGYCSRVCQDYEHMYDFDDDLRIYGEDVEFHIRCQHIEILKLLNIYIRKWMHCGLDVSEDSLIDSSILENLFSRPQNLPMRFFQELEELREITIEPYSFRLSDFLSEMNAVIDYSTMSLAKRNSIDEFFLSNKIHSFRQNFQETAGIIQLQYRKAVARMQLVEPAKDSLSILAGIQLDEICSQIILKFLKNSELKNLIASINVGENVI